MSSVGKLSGRVALVTSGAGPVGAAVARRLAGEGAAVLVADAHDRKGRRVARALRAAGGRSAYVHLDVTSEKEWQSAVVAAACQFDGLDILVNCADAAAGGSIEELALTRWNQVVAANQTGVFLGLKTAVNLLAASDHGSVINIAPAVIGTEDTDGAVSLAAHAVRGAITALTRSVAAH